MNVWREKKGIIIFCLIAIITLIGASATYQMTGPMGIEERFNAAAGITPDEEEGDGGIAGFFLEGNALLYMLVLAVLATTCVAVYRHYRI